MVAMVVMCYRLVMRSVMGPGMVNGYDHGACYQAVNHKLQEVIQVG